MTEAVRCQLRLKELKAESDSIRNRLSFFYDCLPRFEDPNAVIKNMQAFIDELIDHTIHCHEFYDNELRKLLGDK